MSDTTDNRSEQDDGHLPDEADALSELAICVLGKAHEKCLTLATAESCTGGLLASLLTDQQGFGHCFDRSFVTYTDQAKSDLLGIELAKIKKHGAVSAEIAEAMAEGALSRSEAAIAVSITGFAGPAEPGDEVGLVFLACAGRGQELVPCECHFGDLGRERVRHLAVKRALEMIEDMTERVQP